MLNSPMRFQEFFNEQPALSGRESRQLRKDLDNEYGMRPGYLQTNQNGHTPKEMLFWMNKARLEGDKEMENEYPCVAIPSSNGLHEAVQPHTFNWFNPITQLDSAASMTAPS